MKKQVKPKRQITPWRGGHTERLTGRLTPDYMRRLTALRKRRGESEAVCIEWLIELGEKEMGECTQNLTITRVVKRAGRPTSLSTTTAAK